MNVTAIAPRERPAGGPLAIWDRDQLDVIKTLICPGASDAELALFGQVCQKTGLDPFSRQIYGLMRGQRQQVNGEWKTIERLSIQTSIDGFRLIAERTDNYGGQLGPQWCGPDGEWRDVWLAEEYPSAARVGVIRKDWQQPLWAVATWKSYVQTYKDRKSGQDVVGNQWQRMPDVMLAKCAESLALRRAFPAELSGLYTSEEMHQADREEPAPRVRDIPAGPPADDEYPNLSAQLEAERAAEQAAPADGWTPALRKRWEAGHVAMGEVGLAPPKRPPGGSTTAQIHEALKKLGAAISARRIACEQFETLTKQALDIGIDCEVIDPKTLAPDDLANTHAALKAMYDAAFDDKQAAGDDAAPF